MDVNKQKLVKSGIWQFSNTIVIVVSQIVCNAIIARHVSKVEFGIMAITNAFINFACFFSEAGMGDALIQRREIEPQHKNASLYCSVLFSVVIYFILYFTAPLVSTFYNDPIIKTDLFYNNEPILIPVLRILGLSFIFLSLGSASLSLLMKNFKFKQIFFSDSLTLLVSNILGVVLAINHWGVWSLVYSILFYNVARLIMVWVLEPIPLWIGATLRHWKDLFNYGVGLTLVRMYNFISGFGIMLEIGKLVPLKTLGIFERSNRITNIPVRYLGDMINKVMMPFMVKINDEDDKLFAFFYRAMAFSNAMLVPISVFCFVFCQPLVLILLGAKWRDAVLPMQILFLSLPFRITTKLSDILMRVKNLVYKNANRKLQYVIVLCVSIFFCARWGLIGLASAITASSLFSYVAMLLTIKRRVFQQGWQRLIISPFKDGAILSIYCILPSYLVYLALIYSIKDELISFSILCALLGGFLAYAFFKKPALLGKEFAQLQRELVRMVKNKERKGEGRRKRNLEEEENLARITE
jgi:O-antigen/teichoic acid export membrane protein